MPALAERETDTCTVTERGRPSRSARLPATVAQVLTATDTKSNGREIRMNGTPVADQNQPVPRGATVTAYPEIDGG